MDDTRRVAIVTGGGRGIGKAIALLFAREGIDVVVAGRRLEPLKQTVAEIEAANARGLVVQADVGVLSEVGALFDQALGTFGQLDILVNNAGIAQSTESILDLDLSYLDSIYNTDFKGVYLCSRQAAMTMVPQKKGSIINISSVHGLVSLPCLVYGPIKAAVNHFTRILARDLAEHMIRVNCIAPGYVQTDMSVELGRDISLFLKHIPMHTPIMPSDIAELCCFLASDKSRYITGAVIAADAGASSDGGWQAYGR